MARVTFLPGAERDLEDIHEYTVEEWSEAQARRYLVGLRASLDKVASFPHLGVEALPHSGIRVWTYGSHRVVYQAREDGIEVSRIFHAARDVDLVLVHYSALRGGT
jgi:toxin ParE1/3/4